MAALAVVCFHFRGFLPERWQHLCFPSGYLAVDLFFVLSGFVIAIAYDDRLASGMTFARFAQLRLIRLLPMIWVGAAAAAVLMLASLANHPNGQGLGALIHATAFNMLIIPNLYGSAGHIFPSNVPEWSLFYELAANFLFAGAFWALSRAGLYAIISVGGLGVVASAYFFGHLSVGALNVEFVPGAARVTFSFFLGVCLARTQDRWTHLMVRLPAWTVLAIALSVLYAPAPGSFRAVYDAAFVIILSPAIVMLGAVVQPGARGRGIAAGLAAMSYPIYAIHWPAKNWATAVAPKIGVPLPAAALATILFLIPVSLILARYYDEPVRRWLNGKAQSLKKLQGSDAVAN